jgi:hypothetical protein
MIPMWMTARTKTKIIVRMINEIKEERNKCLNEFQENLKN